MNKIKNTIKLISLSAFSISCVFVVAISINNFNPSKADESPYTINFSSSKNVLNSGTSTEDSSTTVTSEKNTSFVFNYSNVVSCNNKWQKVNAGGCFYTKTNDSTYNNKFHDMKTFTFNFDTAGLLFTISFSKNGVFDGTSYEWSRTYATKKGEQVIDAEGHPNYFLFKAGEDSSIDINSLTITYGCSSEADTSWDDAHGVNPLISQDGKTLTYGLYPQTYVATSTDETSELAKALNAKVESLGGINDEEYFWYNDEYYVRNTGNPYDKDGKYTFSDGTTVALGVLYYFKCEPISLNIISSNNATYSLDCTNILNVHTYDDNLNKYDESDIRKVWLNDYFYNQAFFLNNSYIKVTTVNNSAKTTDNDKNKYACKDTDDKIYLRSYQDWNNVDVSSRRKKVSDFAICNNVFMWSEDDSDNRNGWHWTRSPSSSGKNYASYVNCSGSLGLINVDRSSIGWSPALTITI